MIIILHFTLAHLKRECVGMIVITKDDLLGSEYEEVSKWSKKKTKWKLFTEFISNHRILTAGIMCAIACVISNIVLIYNFFKILQEI